MKALTRNWKGEMSLNVASKWGLKDDSYLRMDNLQYRFVVILH